VVWECSSLGLTLRTCSSQTTAASQSSVGSGFSTPEVESPRRERAGAVEPKHHDARPKSPIGRAPAAKHESAGHEGKIASN